MSNAAQNYKPESLITAVEFPLGWGEGPEGVNAACSQHGLKTVRDVYDFLQDSANLQRMARLLHKPAKTNFLIALVRKVVEGGPEFNNSDAQFAKKAADEAASKARAANFPRMGTPEPDEEDLPDVDEDDEPEEEPDEEPDEDANEDANEEPVGGVPQLELPGPGTALHEIQVRRNTFLRLVASGASADSIRDEAGLKPWTLRDWRKNQEFEKAYQLALKLGAGTQSATDVVQEIIRQEAEEPKRRKRLAAERAKPTPKPGPQPEPEPAREPEVKFQPKPPAMQFREVPTWRAAAPDAVAFLSRCIVEQVETAAGSKHPHADLDSIGLLQTGKLLLKAKAEAGKSA